MVECCGMLGGSSHVFTTGVFLVQAAVLNCQGFLSFRWGDRRSANSFGPGTMNETPLLMLPRPQWVF